MSHNDVSDEMAKMGASIVDRLPKQEVPMGEAERAVARKHFGLDAPIPDPRGCICRVDPLRGGVWNTARPVHPMNPYAEKRAGMAGTFDKLLSAIFDAERDKGNGYDALASADWDNVLEYARSLAVVDPFLELRGIIAAGLGRGPTTQANATLLLRLTTDEVLRISELLGFEAPKRGG